MAKKPVYPKKELYPTRFGIYGSMNIPVHIFYKIRQYFFKPKVDIKLLLQGGATEYSEPFLVLEIKTENKQIGNLLIKVKARIYETDTNKSSALTLSFEEPPEVLELKERVLLKCLTELELSNLINDNTRFQLSVEYNYMFLGGVRSVLHSSRWGFNLKNKNYPQLRRV